MRPLPDITIRDAVIEDLPAVLALADEFFTYGGRHSEFYDKEVFTNTARTIFQLPDCNKAITAWNGDILAGYILVTWAKVFTSRPVLYETHFCVKMDYTRTQVGRLLTRAAIDVGEEKDCLAFYAGSTSGIKSFENSILNMYTKFGFSPAGQLMSYKYEV